MLQNYGGPHNSRLIIKIMASERLIPGTLDWEKYSADHLQRYNYFKNYYKDKVVLDLACGAGYGSEIIKNFGAKEVIGVDISSDAVEFAKSNYSNEKLNFFELNYKDIASLKKKFDLIVSFETIEHLPDQGDFLEKIGEVLVDGGQVICSTPNRLRYSNQGIINEFHMTELSIEEFRNLFSKHFKVLKEFGQKESISFKRFLLLKDNLEELFWTINSSPYQRFKNFIKSLLGKKKVHHLKEYDTATLPDDFILEPLNSEQESYNVFILTGTTKI